tara:strand:+ start:262 stop:564 length:303 start_codon:yes stop_codon:yes gene_type:complete
MVFAILLSPAVLLKYLDVDKSPLDPNSKQDVMSLVLTLISRLNYQKYTKFFISIAALIYGVFVLLVVISGFMNLVFGMLGSDNSVTGFLARWLNSVLGFF